MQRNLFDLTGRIVTMKKTWTSHLGDRFEKGTAVSISWHGNECVRVNGRFVVDVKYINTKSVFYAINQVLIKKLSRMTAADQRRWIERHQLSLNFSLFCKVCETVKAEAITTGNEALYSGAVRLQSHFEPTAQVKKIA
jgi:hypothetical protein